MAGRGARFYLGRVIKQGNTLTQDAFVAALRDPVAIRYGEYLYTIIDVETRQMDGRDFIVGKLTKYLPQGEVGVVETERHAGASTLVPNFLRAAARFVYAPDVAAIAYEHVWNEIENRRFEKVLPQVVREKYRDFFVWCAIEPIIDLRRFIGRIAQLERITRVNATVRPPNPLFSPLWRSLRDYTRRRRAAEVAVRERAGDATGLKSDLPTIAQIAPDEGALTESAVQVAVGRQELDIADAAVLMAADGYGKASVQGREKGKAVVIRTRDNQISFEADKEQSSDSLVAAADRTLTAAGERSGLRH